MKRVGQGVIVICCIVTVMVMNWHYRQQVADVVAHYESHEKTQFNNIKSSIEKDFAVIDFYVGNIIHQLNAQLSADQSSRLAELISQPGNRDALLKIIHEAKASMALDDVLVIQQGDVELNRSLLSGGVSSDDSLHIQKHYEWLDQNLVNHNEVKPPAMVSSISTPLVQHFLYSVPFIAEKKGEPMIMVTALVNHEQLQKSLSKNYYLELDGVKYFSEKKVNSGALQQQDGIEFYQGFDVIADRKLWGDWVIGTVGDKNGYHTVTLSSIKRIAITEILLVLFVGLIAVLSLEYSLWKRRRQMESNHQLEEKLAQSNDEIDALKENSQAISHDLLRTELRLHSVLDASTDGVIVCDNFGAITNINSVVMKMFGYAEDEVIGNKIDFLFPELASRLDMGGDSFLESITANSEQSLVEVDAISKDNCFITVELYGKRVKVNDHEACSVIIRDVSERVKNEGEIRDIQQNLRAVIDNIAEGVVTFDAEGVIHAFNPAAMNIFKWKPAVIVGKNISLLMTDRDCEEYQAYLKRYPDLNKDDAASAVSKELIGVREGGEIFDMEIVTSEMVNGDKHLFISIIRDITERKIVEKNMHMSYSELESMVDSHTNDLKKMNNELVKARDEALVAARSKSEFLAMMSHEIRTPINGLLGMLSLMQDTALNDEQADYVETAYSSGEILLALLNDVLDVSKIDAGRMTLDCHDFDVYQLVEKSAKIISKTLHNRNVEIFCYISRDVPRYVNGDAGRLRQVITNLMSNAAKFTEKGSISLSLNVKSISDGKCTLYFDVADTGTGIDAVDAEHIFEEFSQADNSERRQHGGTGLGLAICKKFVAMMGGELIVDSSLGIGSTFSFSADLGLVDKVDNFVTLNACPIVLISEHEIRRAAIKQQCDNWKCIVRLMSPNEALHELASLGQSDDEIVILDLDGMNEQYADNLKRLVTVLLNHKLKILVIKDDVSVDLSSVISEQANKVVQVNRQITPTELLSGLHVLQNRADKGKNEGAVDSVNGIVNGHHLNGISVLVAEDNLVNQKIITAMLGKLGVEADVANNGQEAVDLLSNSEHRYSVVLMDCQMPELDGYAATRKLRMIEKDCDTKTRIPVIAMTAHALPGDREKCLDAGMDDYLTKPIKIEVVRKMIETWM